MGAFDSELYMLGYYRSSSPKKDDIKTIPVEDVLHVARHDCVGSCSYRCLNTWCNAHPKMYFVRDNNLLQLQELHLAVQPCIANCGDDTGCLNTWCDSHQKKRRNVAELNYFKQKALQTPEMGL